MSTQKNVKEFAIAGFILLGVLFGMIIMSFVFGNLSSIDYLDDATQTTINETGGWINATNSTHNSYTILKASQSNFSGGVVIVTAYNNSLGNGTIILPGNYTVNPVTGVITNLTVTAWKDVNLSYTSTYKTDTEMINVRTQNYSLGAISNYASQSGTQFTTLGIAITLVVLVAVFLFFWKAFMGGKGSEGAGSFR